MPRHNFLEGSANNTKSRSALVAWVFDIRQRLGLQTGTAELAVTVADRYLASQGVIGQWQLVGVTVVFMAAKCEEIEPPSLRRLLRHIDPPITAGQVRDMEQAVLEVLDFRLTVPTPNQFLGLLARANGCAAWQRDLAGHIVQLALVDGTTLRYPPSVLASAALLISNQLVGRQVLWPRRMERASGRSQKELAPLAKELRFLIPYATMVQEFWLRGEGVASMPQRACNEDEADGARVRGNVVGRLHDVHRKLNYRTATLHLAISVVDRYLSAQAVQPTQLQPSRLQLVGVAALFIAAQYEERLAPKADVFADIAFGAGTKDDVLDMEQVELEALDFEVMVPTPAHALEYLEQAGCCDAACGAMSRAFLDVALVDGMALKYQPVVLASAAVLISNQLAGRQELWPRKVARASGFSHGELAFPAAELRSLIERFTSLQSLQLRDERASKPQPMHMSHQSEHRLRKRADLVRWLVDIRRILNYRPTTLHLAVSIVDRYLSVQPAQPTQLWLVGVAALFIAAQYEERLVPRAQALADVAYGECTEAQLLATAGVVSEALAQRISLLTPAHYLERLVQAGDCDAKSGAMAHFVMDLALVACKVNTSSPSVFASAALVVSSELLGRQATGIASLTGHRLEELVRPAEGLRRLLGPAPGADPGRM